MSFPERSRGIPVIGFRQMAVVALGVAAAWAIWQTIRETERREALLDPQATSIERTQSVELWAQRGRAVVPELIVALRHDHENVRQSAALTLQRIGPEARDAVPALCERLDDSDQTVRVYALAALQSIGHAPRMVPALVDLLATDADLGVREKAADVLRAVGTAALAELRRAAESPHVDTRQKLIDLLTPPAYDGEPAAVELLRMLLADERAEIRREAFETLQRAGQVTLQDVRRALDDPDPQIVAAGVRSAGGLGDEAAPLIPELAAMLDREPLVARPGQGSSLAKVALEALGRIGPPAASVAPRLRQLLQHEAGWIRYSAALALARIGTDRPLVTQALTDLVLSGDEGDIAAAELLQEYDAAAAAELVPELVRRLRGDDRPLRGHALWVLDVLGPAGVAAVPALIELLDAPQEIDRTRAAGVLGHHLSCAEQIVPALVACIKKHGPDAATSAIQSLGRMGPAAREAVPLLVEIAREQLTRERAPALGAALTALGGIGVMDDAALALLQEAAQHESEFVRPSAVAALGEIAGTAERSVSPLLRALNDMSPQVRQAAARSLGRVQGRDEERVRALRQALNDDNDLVRFQAVLALGQCGAAAEPALPALRRGAQAATLRKYSVWWIVEGRRTPPPVLAPEMQVTLQDAAREAIRKIEDAAR